jgi:hypothetical protein
MLVAPPAAAGEQYMRQRQRGRPVPLCLRRNESDSVGRVSHIGRCCWEDPCVEQPLPDRAVSPSTRSSSSMARVGSAIIRFTASAVAPASRALRTLATTLAAWRPSSRCRKTVVSKRALSVSRFSPKRSTCWNESRVRPAPRSYLGKVHSPSRTGMNQALSGANLPAQSCSTLEPRSPPAGRSVEGGTARPGQGSRLGMRRNRVVAGSAGSLRKRAT